MSIHGILFDFNGTMFFDSPKHKEAWNEFCLTYRNKPITDEELDHMHGQTNKRIIELLLGRTLSDEQTVAMSKAKEALYRKCCCRDVENLHLVPGLEQFLDKCKEEKIPMTICTASIKDNVDFFIETFSLTKWFRPEDIIYDDGTHVDKTTMFLEGAKKIHTPIEKCLVIEDSFSGIAFARAVHAGKIVAITSNDRMMEYNRLEGVDFTIQNFIDFHKQTI